MNNDHMQQAEKELSEEREMKLDFICKKCGSIEYEIKDKSNGTGIAHGLYCAKCGFWHKWIGKEELKRFSETKQKEKVYSVDEVNHLISEMDKVIAKLKTENVALRERLEKAVELPCKLYDKVWDKNRSEFEILEIRVTGTNFYIYCGNKTTGETVYFDGEDIGDEWFTTEEACDLHRRAFGLDKPKNESDEVRLAELKQDYIVFSNLRDTRNTRQDL